RQPRAAEDAPSARGRAGALAAEAAEQELEPGERRNGHETRPAPAGPDLVAEALAAGAVAQVATQRCTPQRGAAKGRQLLANLCTRRLARVSAGDERGARLESERLDLLARAAEKLGDLLVRNAAELGEHERGALVVRQPSDVGQDRSELLTRDDLGRKIAGRLR